MACGRMLPLAVAAALAFRAQAQPRNLLLSGACDEKNFLNSLLFRLKGRTKSGAPWYKAQEHQGDLDVPAQYLYWDPDCAGGKDGQSRWIIDSDEPSLDRDEDLDGDGICKYHARVDSVQWWTPPETAHWFINCGRKGWQERFMTFIEVTSTTTTTTETRTTTSTTTTATTTSTTATRTSTTRTSTSTSTTTGTATTTTRSSTTTSRTSSTSTATTSTTTTATWTGTSVTATATSTTTMTTSSSTTQTKTTTATSTLSTTGTRTRPRRQANWLTLSGACAYKGFLNGMAFEEYGTTAIGAPLYKAVQGEQYIYYDLDCSGKGTGSPRWVIDEYAPRLDRTKDLDDDGACNYHARLKTEDHRELPKNASWNMFCGTGWEDRQLVFEGCPKQAPLTALRIDGACPDMGWLNGLVLAPKGATARGSTFYAGQSSDGTEVYLYHDLSCDGNATTPARWILDDSAPDAHRADDLDGDRQCDYHARVDSGDASRPPAHATWRMACGGTWNETVLALEAHVPADNSNATTTVAHGFLMSAAEGHGCSAVLALLAAANVLLRWG